MSVIFANDIPFTDGTDDPFKSLRDTLAFAVDDWAATRAMAWTWGIIEGWDSESMGELAEQFKWTPEQTARLNRLHEAFARAAAHWALPTE